MNYGIKFVLSVGLALAMIQGYSQQWQVASRSNRTRGRIPDGLLSVTAPTAHKSIGARRQIPNEQRFVGSFKGNICRR